MSGKKRLLLALVGACGLVLLCSEAWAWQVTINGTANNFDLANAVTVDAAGDVVAAGGTENIGTGLRDFTVVKLAGATGVELWRQEIDGTANGIDFAFKVAVDAAGDVVAAGRTQNTATDFGDFTVVKLRGTDGGDF